MPQTLGVLEPSHLAVGTHQATRVDGALRGLVPARDLVLFPRAGSHPPRTP